MYYGSHAVGCAASLEKRKESQCVTAGHGENVKSKV